MEPLSPMFRAFSRAFKSFEFSINPTLKSALQKLEHSFFIYRLILWFNNPIFNPKTYGQSHE